MKIGVITITDRENYGNRLQNYAVQTVLEKRGHKVETIRKSRYKENLLCKIKLVVRKTTGIKYARNWKRYVSFKKFNNKCIKFSRYYIKSDDIDEKLSSKYDLFVCGSDQIWNPEFEFNSDSEYLSFVTGKKKIALAASIGLHDIPDEKKSHIKGLLKSFGHISVREEKAKELIQELYDSEISVICDPTIMLTAEEWTRIEKRPRKFPYKKYILCYILGKYTQNMIEKIKEMAGDKYHVVFLEHDCYNFKITTEEEFSYGPSEFVWLVRNAEKIITDSFHATVFSLLYEKKFCVISDGEATENMGSRFEQLSLTYCIKNIYAEQENFENVAEVDYDYVKDQMNQQREIFNNFLDYSGI